MLQLLNTSLKDLSNSKVREMELEDAEKEVQRLEQEARRVLKENKRYGKDLSTKKIDIVHSYQLKHICSFLTLESKRNYTMFQLSRAQRTVT